MRAWVMRVRAAWVALGANGTLSAPGPAAVPAAPAAPQAAWSPFAGLAVSGRDVRPEPGPYALLGVLLLAAGLLGSRLLRR